ncbi:MAG: hypothetical protein JNJ89_16705 [Rubrivivax sp.]|nr:hypothetical protein [Rubrivivax sp.]
MATLTEEIALAAARLVVEEGLEYAAAKRRAARDLGRRSQRQGELPANEAVEDAVREHLALFHAETQPAELAALRRLALRWMERLAEFRPYLVGAVWRGTATRLSAVHLDLYCGDIKAAEIALVNAGVDFELAPGSGPDDTVFTAAVPCRELGEAATLHLRLLDLDELRGALKPDARGRTWRGDLAALRRLVAEEEGASGGPAP